jgi:hypothetical protein
MENCIASEGFSWNETWYHLEIYVPLCSGSCRPTIEIKPKSVKITLPDQQVIEGELHDYIYPADSTWYIQDGELVVDLCKRRDDKLWKRVFTRQTPSEVWIEGKRHHEMDKHSEEYRHVHKAFQFSQQVDESKRAKPS